MDSQMRAQTGADVELTDCRRCFSFSFLIHFSVVWFLCSLLTAQHQARTCTWNVETYSHGPLRLTTAPQKVWLLAGSCPCTSLSLGGCAVMVNPCIPHVPADCWW